MKISFHLTPIGEIATLWKKEPHFQLCSIFLPPVHRQSWKKVHEEKNEKIELFFSQWQKPNQDEERQKREILKTLNPDLSLLTLFQKKVLLYLFQHVPKGTVITYGCLAKKLNCPSGSRAVGTVMKKNPFPLLFPCHRVIQSGGKLGYFQGKSSANSTLKGRLLKWEGIKFDPQGNISPEFILN